MRVLDVGGLAARLAQECKPGSALSSAEFALQLVGAAERLTLAFEGSTR
ncbi:hypothetical protein ACFYN3_28455 [Streptomyces lavendulae]